MGKDTSVQNCGAVTCDDEKRGRYVSPAVDIQEDEDKFTLTADLPGVMKGDLNINIEQTILTIEANIADRYLTEGGLFHSAGYDGYHRKFKLTDSFDQSKIDAELKDGVLTLNLPRSEAAKPKQIEVTVH